MAHFLTAKKKVAYIWPRPQRVIWKIGKSVKRVGKKPGQRVLTKAGASLLSVTDQGNVITIPGFVWISLSGPWWEQSVS